MVIDKRHTLTMGRLQGRLSMVPARTHPKAILSAKGDPGGPNRRPWSTFRLNTWASRIKSMFPEMRKSASACWRFERCIQLFSKDTRVDGTLMVTLGRTTPSIAMTSPRRVVRDTLKLTTPREPECTWCRSYRWFVYDDIDKVIGGVVLVVL